MNLIEYIVYGVYVCLGLITHLFNITRNRWVNFSISTSILISLCYFFLIRLEDILNIDFSHSYSLVLISICIGLSLYGLFFPSSDKNQEQKGAKHPELYLESIKGKKIRFGNPYDNFLVYAGANAGKTKSIGKPLLEQYIQNGFAGFIYDYKDFDYTKTAYNLIKKHEYKKPFYHISFTDMNRTYRFNPIKPSVLEDENLLVQLMDDVLGAYLGEGSKKDEWYYGALGVLRGVAIRFFKDFPECCTLPHIVNFIIHSERKKLYEFLMDGIESRALASGYLDAIGSERTQASILSTLTNYISGLAFNKNIAYVLSGDDFDFNLIDPTNSKMIAVSNSYTIESVISPIIALMISVSSRHFTMANKVPFVYFWDEATTFKIRDFEKMPSVLREYLCSFVFLTQSGAKIEKNYGKLDRSSIESNFSNLFLGRTKDTEALKNYGMFFSKKEEMRRTDSYSSSNHGENLGRSVTKVEKERYDPYFFTGLQAGEFVGSAAHSNFQEFHLRFKQYDNEEIEDLPTVHFVTKNDVEENYKKLLQELENIGSEVFN